MAYDVIVVGSGIGGLSCAAKLAARGIKVLVLEKDRHIGGTSYIFRRNGYAFPMGPLAFSFPQLVRKFLAEVGAGKGITFRRNDFQLISPGLDIVYSNPLERLREELKGVFPQDSGGLDRFFVELKRIIALAKDLHLWHPDYQLKSGKELSAVRTNLSPKILAEIRWHAETPCRRFLDRLFSSVELKNFLGSQGTTEPEMSMLNLAFMWNVMSEIGIWYPSCGIHGLSERLRDIVLQTGGEVRLSTPVEKIIISAGGAVGVKTLAGEYFHSGWTVSNADYKKTFFELISPGDCPQDFLSRVSSTPYTGSEMCVYIGIDPSAVDLSRRRASHLFYRYQAGGESPSSPGLEDFENREIEICFWSENAPEHVPPGKASLILRAAFPYKDFAHFRTGEKKRKEGYRPHKVALGRRLINTAEHALPGLGSAVEVMEIATPLTYEDWGHRTQGSIAGWTWDALYARAFGQKLLVATPIKNLLMAGIYASTELFLGGVPTAMHTGSLAADIILGDVFPVAVLK